MVSARTTRQKRVQSRMAIAAMTDPTPAPRTATRRIESRTGGKAIQISTSREIKTSIEPRYQPASNPSAVPASPAEPGGKKAPNPRDRGAIDETRKHVAAKVVGAEIITGLRARESQRRQGGEHQVLVERVLRRDPWGEQRDHDQRENKAAADRHLGLSEQSAHATRGEARARSGKKRGSGGVSHRRSLVRSRAQAWRSFGLNSATRRSTAMLIRMKITANVSTSP